MARKGKISDLYDVARIQEQQAQVLALIDEYVRKVNEGSGAKIALQNATKPSEMLAGMQQVITAQKEQAKTALDVVSAYNAMGTAVKTNTQLLNEAIAARTRLNNTINSLKASLREDAQLLKDGTITRQEYNQRVTESEASIAKATTRVKEMNVQIAQLTRTEKAKSLESQKNSKIEADANAKQVAILQKSINQINTQRQAYNLLEKEYKEVAMAAKNFNVELGASNPLTVAATRNAFALRQRLKEIDASVGETGKNVGNYAEGVEKGTSKIATGVGKIWSVVRNLAYILPGIGIAGIFAAASDAVGSFLSMMFKTEKAMTRLKAESIALNGAFKDSAYKEAIKNIQELTTYIDLAKKGFVDKKVVLDQYNKVLGDSVGKAKDLNEAEQLLIKNGKAYIEMTLYKAAANAALNEAAELALDVAKDQLDPEARRLAVTLRRTEAEQKYGKKIRESAEYTRLLREEGDALNQSLSNRTDETIKEYDRVKGQSKAYFEDQLALMSGGKKEQNRRTLVDIATDFQRKAAEIAGTFQLDLFGNKDLKTPEPKKETKDAKDEIYRSEAEKRKTLFEIRKRILQDQIDFNEQSIADDQRTFEERYKAAKYNYDIFVGAESEQFQKRLGFAQQYYDKSLELINSQKTFDLKEIDEAEKEAKRKADGQAKNKAQAEKLKQAITEEFAAKRRLVEANTNTAILKLNETGEKQITGFMKKSYEERQKAKEESEKANVDHMKSVHEVELQELSNQYNEDLLTLDKKFAKGRMKEEEYNKKRLRLQVAYQLAVLEEDIKFTKETIALAEARALASGKQEDIDAVILAKKKLAALEMQVQQTINEFGKKSSEDTLKNFQATLEKAKDYASKLFDIIGGLVKASTDRQLNAIEDQIDALEEKKQKDIEVANASVGTAEQRAAQIAIIEARASAEKEALERKQRKLKEENARFEKAATIASLIMETALAVVRALGSKPYTPANIGLAIATGAFGAAQIAVAIAQPIPKYEKGGKHPRSGPAIVGEKRAELVDVPGQGMFVVKKPTYFENLPGGSVIHPDADAVLNEQMKRQYGLLDFDGGKQVNKDELIVMGLKDIEQAVKNIPQANITVANPLSKRIRYGDSSSIYLQRNLQNR